MTTSVGLMIRDDEKGQVAHLELDVEAGRLARSLLFAADAVVQNRAQASAPSRSLRIDGEELVFEGR